MRHLGPPQEKPSLRYIGLSRDQRANQWEFSCTCGYRHEPPTTRLAVNTIDCPKCARKWLVNYNTEEIKLEEP